MKLLLHAALPLLAAQVAAAFVAPAARRSAPFQSRLHVGAVIPPPTTTSSTDIYDGLGPEALSASDDVSPEQPLTVLIAGAGVGGLALAKALSKMPHVQVRLLEQTSAFKRFGGPIQLASNAMRLVQAMDEGVFRAVSDRFTVTGDKTNGIKDGIRTEWYAKFDLSSPAAVRGMPFTGVIDRPDLQEIYLQSLPPGTVANGDGVDRYEHLPSGQVRAVLNSGREVYGDCLIGADGIWSAVRATMRGAPKKGAGSGATYSGYTVFAGELKYDSFDNGEVGYKVYIGPGQYFVITDIGKGMYQWYAFLARPPDSAATEEKPDGTSKYLQNIFEGWSQEIHHILVATQEDEIEQRDLYDRPPSVREPWVDGRVALLGDAVHAMMPNLGQGGCQAIEDAFVIAQELQTVTKRSQVHERLKNYQNRRLVRSAAVQGLSRFASDIIIRGFDTPAKIVKAEDGSLRFENFNYAGIVTKLLQPILPIFFKVQFNFLYDGWENESAIDLPSAFGFATIGGAVLLLLAGSLGEAGIGIGLGADALLGTEGLVDLDATVSTLKDFF